MPNRELFAWIMFTLSGMIFLIIGWRAGDWLAIVSAAFWLIGCFAFMTGSSE